MNALTGFPVHLVQIAITGSGDDMLGVFGGNVVGCQAAKAITEAGQHILVDTLTGLPIQLD